MTKTHTKFISFGRLARIEGADLVVGVALVCNDMGMANSSMGRYKTLEGGTLSHIRRGGGIYFSRLISGHLYEGMKTIGQIRRHKLLSSFVGVCSSNAQSAFRCLCDCLPGGKEDVQFSQYVGWIRNKVAFHYDPGHLRWAIEDRSSRERADTASLTGGGDIHTTRFEFADDILDSIVCRKIWRIPRSADVETEADRIGGWCNDKSIQFLRFGEDFVPRFLIEKGVTI